MTDPIPPDPCFPVFNDWDVATGQCECVQLCCMDGGWALIEYAEMLRVKCDELDRLLPMSRAFLVEAGGFLFLLRALSEFSALAASLGDSSFNQIAIATAEFYAHVLHSIGCQSPLRRTHPLYYGTFTRVSREAVELMSSDPRLPRTGTTLSEVLFTLETSRPAFLQDVMDNYVMVNYQALAERVGGTPLAGEAGRLACESLQRASEPGLPYDAPLQQLVTSSALRPSAMDMLQWISRPLPSITGSGPVGNTVAMQLMHVAMHNWRLIDNRRSSFPDAMVRWMVWACPSEPHLGAYSMGRRETIIEYAMLSLDWETVRHQLRTRFQRGPLATLAPMLADWINLIFAVEAFVHPDPNRTSGWDSARRFNDILQSGISTVADTAITVTRVRDWIQRGVTASEAARRMLAAKFAADMQMFDEFIAARAAEAAARAAEAAAQEARVAVLLEHGPEAFEQFVREQAAAARAARTVTYTYETPGIIANSGLTRWSGRPIASVGGAITFGFSAVNAVFEGHECWSDARRGDGWGALMAGVRCVGSVLICVSIFCTGPIGPAIGLLGLIASVGGASLDSSASQPLKSVCLGLIRDIENCRSTDHVAPALTSRPESRSMVQVLGLSGQLQRLSQTINEYRGTHGLYVTNQNDADSIQEMLRAIGLDPARLPDDLVRQAQARGVLLL